MAMIACACACSRLPQAAAGSGLGISASSLSGVQLSVHNVPGRYGSRSRALLRTKCESSNKEDKPSFGYTRKDVLLIGAGITVFGFALKSGLELAGLDPLKSGNVVQLVMVLGLTVGWILSYIFRVSNKDMTYTKQLKDYELKVMEKRYQELPEAELEALLAQVEEEKERLKQRKAKRTST